MALDTLFPLGMSQYIVGGLCIGLAVSLIFLLTGQVAGMSSFFSTSLSWISRLSFFQQRRQTESRAWRLYLALGLVAGAALSWFVVSGQSAWRTEVPLWQLVLGSAVITTLIMFQVAPRLKAKPVLETEFYSHYSGDLKPTLVGAAIFGIGWGVCGVCPGPAIAGLGQGNWDLLACLAAMFAGAWCHGLYMSRQEFRGQFEPPPNVM